MANSTFLSTTDLDFNALRSAMKDFLRTQDRIRDYDFDGSNMSVLLDVLAWNAHLKAHYLNQVGSEMFVDTARLLDSMYSHAKELNYTPRSVTSARADVVLTIDTGSDAPDTVTVPKHHTFSTRFTDETGFQTTYTFSTTEDVVVARDDSGSYVSANVEIVEGELVREVFAANSTARYVLASANVDVSTLEVVVQVSNTDTSNTTFDRAYNLYGVTAEDPVYFVQGAYDGKFEVAFGDGVIGTAVTPGNLVRITYLDSKGEAPNGARVFTATDTQEGYSIDVDVVNRAYGGADRESIESIRYYAPRHFTTQERATVKDDFTNLVRERFPQLEAVTSYGGEEVTPKRYGKVVLSVKPYGDEVISDRLKDDILTYLSGKNIVTEPVIIDAEYLYAKVTARVTYDRDRTFKSEEQIKSTVREAILAYGSANLSDFGVDLRASRLSSAVDEADDSIVSNDTRIELVKRWRPVTGSTQGLVFSFGNQLLSQTRESDVEHHDPIVYTSSFTYRKNSVNYTCILQDDGDGTMVVVSLEEDGSKTVLESDVGTVDYDTGDVSASLRVWEYDTVIKVYGVPESRDVSVAANLFLSIRDEDVTVSAARV